MGGDDVTPACLDANHKQERLLFTLVLLKEVIVSINQSVIRTIQLHYVSKKDYDFL